MRRLRKRTAGWPPPKRRWRATRPRPTASSARTRDALARSQRDFESLRRDYSRTTKIVGLSLAFIAPLALLILALLGWLLAITRKLATRVHDVPTLVKIQEYETHVARLHDQLNAEKSHNVVLRERLAKLGIVD